MSAGISSQCTAWLPSLRAGTNSVTVDEYLTVMAKASGLSKSLQRLGSNWRSVFTEKCRNFSYIAFISIAKRLIEKTS